MISCQIIFMVLNVHRLEQQTAPPPGYNGMGASPLFRIYKLTLMALGAMVMSSRMSMTTAVLKQLNRFFLAFLVLATLSVAWSIASSATMARLVTLAAAVVVCYAFAVGAWYPRRLQDVLRTPLTLILVASLLVGMYDPTLVKETGNDISLHNSWLGLTSQKNEFGEVSTFALILWFHGYLTKELPWHRVLPGIAVAGTCLLLSRSSTSLFCSTFVIMLMLILLRSGSVAKRYHPYIVGAFATVCVLYGLAVMQVVPGIERIMLDPVTAFTGKSMTFSNRTVIWGVVQENIARHPYLGSGYGAYWGAGPVPSSPSYEFLGLMGGFWPTETHNGYFEMRNDLGLVGLLCLLGYMFVFLRQSLALFRVDRAQSTLFLALLFDQTLLNLSESTWLDIYNFCFSVMTVTTFALARALVEHRKGTYGPPYVR